MTTASGASATGQAAALHGQTVVVIGGSAGIGLETARRARAEGAEVVLTARNPDRLQHAARELGALSSEAFDAADPDRLARFFQNLPAPIDHVMVTAGGMYYAPLAEFDFAQARRAIDEHLWLTLHVARDAAGKVRPGGTLLFMTGTAARRTGAGLAIAATVAAALPALTANLALEFAPVRVNLIATGFVDTALSGAPRRSTRTAPGTAPRHAPDQARRRTRRRGRARGAPHDQHCSHGCHLRRRRRPADRHRGVGMSTMDHPGEFEVRGARRPR
jgi:NAD(P)-dependent dehydrogenase (short-subunit alcohol dehydrogenase family)